MNKPEALSVLHEIAGALRESTLISSVSLDQHISLTKDPKDESYHIRIKCDLDNYSRKSLKPILNKHNLILKEEKGYIVIFPS